MLHSEEKHKRSLLNGFEPEIFELVREHATPEQWREWLRAPLEHAAAKGKTDLFTRLMDAGADGSAGWRGCHGRTLLIAAAQGKSDKIVRRLMTAGSKTEVNVLFDGDDSYDEDTCEGSALHGAANLGAEAVSRVLLYAGADPNLQDSEKQTPLHVAAYRGHDVVMGVLLLKRANPDAKDRSEKTPLHLAAEQGHDLCVSELLQGGAEMNARDSCGDTPLIGAAQADEVGTFEELVAAGAGLDTRNCLHWSLLDCAASNRSLDVVRSILRHGGDITATNDDGFTALHHAALCSAHWNDNSGVVRVLLKAGANIEAKTTEDSSTPLDHAVSVQDTSSATVLALLEGGAAVNARRALGRTPLHTACDVSNVDAVDLLLQWGADETLADQDGQTAWDMVGGWDEEDDDDDDDDDEDDKQRKDDDHRIRDMLARAPADRSWPRLAGAVPFPP